MTDQDFYRGQPGQERFGATMCRMTWFDERPRNHQDVMSRPVIAVETPEKPAAID